MRDDQSKSNVWKGALAGLVAGLVASWTMNRFQDVWSAISTTNNSMTEDSLFETGQLNNQTSQSNDQSSDDATVKTATAIAAVFGHQLTPNEKKIGGTAVHYAVGATGGMVYGVVAEFLPEVTTGFGLPYGVVFWLSVDEGALPLLGLSKGPTAYPLSTHIYALASHLVFGVTAEGIRRALRG